MSRQAILKLKALRVEHGLTQDDIAEKLGVTTATYSRKENGLYDFTVAEVKKLFKIYPNNRRDLFRIFFDFELTEMVIKSAV